MKRLEVACLAIVLAVPIAAQDPTRMDLTKHGRVIAGQVMERIKQACSDYTWSVQHNKPRPPGSLKLTDDVRAKIAAKTIWAILVPDHKIGGDNWVSAVGISSAPSDFKVFDDEYQLLRTYAGDVANHAAIAHESYAMHKAAGDNAAAKQDIAGFEQSVISMSTDAVTNGLVGSIMSDVDTVDLAGYTKDCVGGFQADLVKSYKSAGLDISAVSEPRELHSFGDVASSGSTLLSADVSKWFGPNSKISKIGTGKDGSDIYGVWRGNSLMLIPYSGKQGAADLSSNQLEEYARGKFGVKELPTGGTLPGIAYSGYDSYIGYGQTIDGDSLYPTIRPHPDLNWGSTIAPLGYGQARPDYLNQWSVGRPNDWGTGMVYGNFTYSPAPVVSFSRGWTEKSVFPQGESVAAIAVSIVNTGSATGLSSVTRLSFGNSSDSGGPPSQDWTPASLSSVSLDIGEATDMVVGFYAGAIDSKAVIGDSAAIETALKMGWSATGKLPFGLDKGSAGDAVNRYLATMSGFIGSISVSVQRSAYTGYSCSLAPLTNIDVVKPKTGSGTWYRITTPAGGSHWLQIVAP